MTIVGGYTVPTDFPEPAADFRLRVEIANVWVAWFTECSGLGAERETLPVPEGGVNDHVHELPKGVKYPRVSLKRGLADEQLWSWFQEGLYDCKIVRKEGDHRLVQHRLHEGKEMEPHGRISGQVDRPGT